MMPFGRQLLQTTSIKSTAAASMTASRAPAAFSSARFLKDFKKTATAIGSPYKESIIAKYLEVFEEPLTQGAVTWRSTNRPNDVLNYRVYLRERLDTIGPAINAGYIKPSSPMARLATCWSKLYEGTALQWIDFHPEKGLVKTWFDLRGGRPVEEILNAAEVPECVRAQGPVFREVGLESVGWLAVDYEGNTLNLYFTGPGPITEEQAAKYTKLAQCDPPTEQEFRDMKKFLHPTRFSFAVTMKYETGAIPRVAFYALNLPEKELPSADERVKRFFEIAPSYDEKQTRNVAWSFGVGNKKYMKCAASYSGEVAMLLKDVRAPLSS